jgi:Pectate lyase superfamily protein/Secretion system C-terminal sorting domain
MKKMYFIIPLIFIHATITAQVIPANRQVIWNGAGIPDNNPVITNEINVMSFGAIGDSIHDDANAIDSAINSLGGRAGVVYFPPGEYMIESTLNLPDSVILRGDCNDSAHLVFNLGGAAIDCIDAQVYEADSFHNIISGFSKDTNIMVVDSAYTFHVGDYAEIEETNGPWDVVPAYWALNCLGQIVHITAVSGNKITFENPLRIAYTPSLTPQVRKWTPRVFVGIEDLKITRVDTGLPGGGYQISFLDAMNCWVKGVESSHSVGAHVAITTSSNITVSGCYFHNAYAYDGVNTRGYGVMMIQHAGECLVENNVFDSLRHSVIVKQGANGNVAAYNYSTNEYRSEFPNNGGADLVCHGHYSFANLFESNVVNNIQVDSTWGPTGPYTTFYRNRATLYGILMTPGASVMSDTLNWVGNETTNSSAGLFYLAGINHYVYGNNVLGTITPAGTNNLTDTSYYRTSFTDIFGHPPYPPTIGLPNVLDSGTIPAMQRFLMGGKITISAHPPCILTGILGLNADKNAEIYPDPASNDFYIRYNSTAVTMVEIYSVDGRLIYKNTINPDINLTEINTTDFTAGIYLVRLVSDSESIVKKLVIEK